MSTTPDGRDSGASPRPAGGDVTYKHAFAFGAVAALAVLILTIIFLRAWQSIDAVIASGLMTAGAFVGVTGVTALLVWFDRRKPGGDQPPDFPVLK
ncbi:hypothetical protein [Sediminivirga luteola]|jgi:hypothetical protein|uniref:Uncharacterized protein n=1 Tax=Sediminivirga luteola TaxID=1774748 RepID=A0A8J2U0X2_9MICO|nr:hypothetical protein [Sediminivirga luteola]MCI2264539.1 hypothetical protein [Sediminivirga luteola]GGA25947.1 hypothetical protein GCM10011333_31140 [Sediminivirga luteola]